jgi:Fe-Mn family superoxide dismutase
MENQKHIGNNDMFAQTYPFANVPLTYGYNAFEPYIDTQTMHLHHDKHLQTYINNLNAALEPHTDLHGLTLSQLIIAANTKKMPDDLKTAIVNNGGGVYNHFFYFDQLRPATGEIVVGLSGRLRTMLDRDFESLEKFKADMKAAALKVFGSGYAWLVAGSDGKLSIMKTGQQGTPITEGLTPLLNLDVWEHAYYLKYFNVRADYIDAFWNLVDWTKLSKKLDVFCMGNDGCIG